MRLLKNLFTAAFFIVGIGFFTLALIGASASERRTQEVVDSLKVCAKIHDDFWRDQCYSDIAKIKAHQEAGHGR